MKVSFFLWKSKKSKKTGKVPMYVMVNLNGKCIRKPIQKVSIYESDWDKEKQKIKERTKGFEINNAREFNFELTKLKNNLNELWAKSFVSGKEINEDQIVDIIFKRSHVSEVLKEGVNLIKGFESFIEQNKSHRAKRTIIGYGTTLRVFVGFKEWSGHDMLLSNINMDFFDRFRNYCFEVKQFKNNTFAKTINNLKTFMNWAEERDLHSNATFRKFKAFEERIEVIFLTHEELHKLNEFQFKSKRLEQARDIYCFSCFTGLRYSDMANLKPSNIFENEIKVNVTKTKSKDLVIPLIKPAKLILEKYKETVKFPLPMISSQKLNEYIKEACQKVGINTPVTITRYSGRERIEKTMPKYELITLHTGRKTFVTNSLLLGLSPFQVKEITGHKSDSSFRKYVSISNIEKSNQLNSAWNKF